MYLSGECRLRNLKAVGRSYLFVLCEVINAVGGINWPLLLSLLVLWRHRCLGVVTRAIPQRCVAAVNLVLASAPSEAHAAGTGWGLAPKMALHLELPAGLGQSLIYSCWIFKLLLLDVCVSSAQCCRQIGSGALEELCLFSVGTGG